jgi:fumarate reductase iron-sulfur subunit
MNIKICNTTYSLEQKVESLLSALTHIKSIKNPSLSYRSGCRSGVCGSCAVLVNGKEQLACQTTVCDNDIVEPLKNLPVIKDLVVDLQHQSNTLQLNNAFLEKYADDTVTSEDEKRIDTESNCILCNSCFSSCPVYETHPQFTGPFSLTRVYRYIQDKKEQSIDAKIESIQTNGIWDCTLCGNCNMVCPSHINITSAITQLRNKSAMLGYNDPNLQNFTNDFNSNLDFGFDPNSF